MVNALEETRELLGNHHDFVSKNPHHDFVSNNSHHDVTMSTEARCSRYPRLPDPRDPRNRHRGHHQLLVKLGGGQAKRRSSVSFRH